MWTILISISLSLLYSMETLSEMFELELPTVHSIISKMIINEELMVRRTANVKHQKNN